MSNQTDKFVYNPDSVFPKSIQEWQHENSHLNEHRDRKMTLEVLNDKFRKLSEEINNENI